MSQKRKININSSGALVTHGFTLIEILITLSIAAILAVLATPSMTESIENSKIKTLSGEFTVALHLAQSEAIKRGVQVSIKPKFRSNKEWRTGWDIFADPNANGSQDAGEELIQTYDMNTKGLTLISEDAVFATWMGFLPSGATRGNGGISGGFRICRADGETTKSRTVIIQATGNIITEVGASSCP